MQKIGRGPRTQQRKSKHRIPTLDLDIYIHIIIMRLRQMILSLLASLSSVGTTTAYHDVEVDSRIESEPSYNIPSSHRLRGIDFDSIGIPWRRWKELLQR